MDVVITLLALGCLVGMAGYILQLLLSQFRLARVSARSTELEREYLQARIGLISNRRRFEREKTELSWNGTRKFKAVKKVTECRDVYSFYLAPHDGKPLPPFLPGQYLTFRLNIAGHDKPVIRCYSLSDSPNHPDYYRVTIKKIPPPPDKPGVPPGLSSSFFHDRVAEGDILDVRAPSGAFCLDMTKLNPVVMISGGVGITPVLSMTNAIVESGARREVWFFYGARNRSDHIMKEHLERLAAENRNVHLQVCYSNPGPDDQPGRDYHHGERVSVDLLKRLLPSNNYEFYICGPPPMMSSITQGLKDWGVPDDHVRFEAFGPATVKRAAPVAAPAAVAATAQTFEISFARSGKVLSWDHKMESLLDFAEHHGVSIDFGCRAGSCGTCKVAVKSGEFAYLRQPDFPCEAGSCLTCCAVPKTNLGLDA